MKLGDDESAKKRERKKYIYNNIYGQRINFFELKKVFLIEKNVL